MEATTFPTAEQAITIIRKQARHAHPAVPRPAQRGQIRSAQPISDAALRSRVFDAFRTVANGTGASTAQEQTTAFYRSSGMAWAHSLTEHGGREVQRRVLEAFREIAHGVQDLSAHDQTLRFYRSGGQAWAKTLG